MPPLNLHEGGGLSCSLSTTPAQCSPHCALGTQPSLPPSGVSAMDVQYRMDPDVPSFWRRPGMSLVQSANCWLASRLSAARQHSSTDELDIRGDSLARSMHAFRGFRSLL